jgi:hypothetical protein
MVLSPPSTALGLNRFLPRLSTLASYAYVSGVSRTCQAWSYCSINTLMNISVATYPRVYVHPLEKHELESVTSTCTMSCNVLLQDCTRHTSLVRAHLVLLVTTLCLVPLALQL